MTFHGLSLRTAAGRVMTPRPASEALVDAAVALVARRPACIVDVGTGSGAIAVAIASALPEAEVLATDTSAAAVALARANVCQLGLDGRVTVCQGDLLEPVGGSFDLIVANLPYLPLSGAPARTELGSEPPEAVFAPGDGLDPYRRLIRASRKRLTGDGTLVIQLHRRVHTASRSELELAEAIYERLGFPPAVAEAA